MQTFKFEQSAFRTSAHTGLKNISFHTRLQAAEAPHKSSVLRGGKEAMCATPKVCTRRNILKIIIQLLILPAIP